MRKLTVAASIATLAVAAAPAAHAADASIGGVVATICEISNLDANFSDFNAMTAGNLVYDDDISIRCNSPGGVSVSMASLGGGLDSGAEVVEYTATLDSLGTSGLGIAIDTAGTGAGSDSTGGNTELATTGEPFYMEVILSNSATYSGNFGDTIRILLTPQ